MTINPFVEHGFWIFDEDFTAYANEAAMVTAGYSSVAGNHNLDAANDEFDMLGNGETPAGIALWDNVAIRDALLYSIEADFSAWVAAPLIVKFIGGVNGGSFALNDTGTGTFRREDVLSGTSNVTMNLDSNAATDSTISGWRFTETIHVPKA